MTQDGWVRIPGGQGNWLRFDPLTDDEMAAIVKRLDTDYGLADLAGRYAEAWLDVARLISTLAAVSALADMGLEQKQYRAFVNHVLDTHGYSCCDLVLRSGVEPF